MLFKKSDSVIKTGIDQYLIDQWETTDEADKNIINAHKVTVTGINMEKDEIEKVIREILLIDVNDGITFEFEKLEPIREDDDYNNFRAHFIALYGKIANKMKIDITTGDEITPAAIQYSYKTNGAVVMIYDDVLQDLTDRAMGPLYDPGDKRELIIIPSSRHEILALDANAVDGPELACKKKTKARGSNWGWRKPSSA